MILSRLLSGDIPDIADLIAAGFSGDQAWDIRLAAFGDLNSAARFASSFNLSWTVGYDSRAAIEDIASISVTPAHALICVTLRVLSTHPNSPYTF